MLSTDRILRITIEVLFVFLGALVVWLGVTRHIFFDRTSLGWAGVSLLLILWGGRGLWKPSRLLSPAENWTRGLSVVLLGAIMLVISRVGILWVGPLLAVAGGVLLLRGLLSAALILRESPRAV